MKVFNSEQLLDAIENTTNTTNISKYNIEKDYYICQILSEIEKDKSIDYAIFRGGTSLSKCWNVVDRFSEDIDFSMSVPVSVSKRRLFKYKIKEICDNLGLEIINFEKLRSRTAMNRYDIRYPSILNNDNAIIYLEMSFFSISIFIIEKKVQSYIGKQMDSMNINASEYGLEPFNVKTQTLEKTFVDKVFALCDYALTGRINKGSRHIYDLYKIYPLIKDNPELKNIIDITRYDRMKREKRPSSYSDCDVNVLLKQIVDTGIFKDDYVLNTYNLLNEKIPYDTAIRTIETIADSDLIAFNPDFEPVEYLINAGFIDRKNAKEIKTYRQYFDKPFYVEKPVIPKTLI